MPKSTLGGIYSTFNSYERFKAGLNYLLLEANRLLHKQRSPPGSPIIDEEWDNLFILDGCRYDVFENHHNLKAGTLERRQSMGSDSYGFLYRNFVEGQYHDTVYVSANPFTRIIPENTFHAVYNLLGEEWDENIGTVPPETVAERAQEIHRSHPDKRLIVHFMQPHYPFLGPTGDTFEHGGIVEFNSEQEAIWEPEAQAVWGALRFGRADYTVKKVWEAYVENLDIVLNAVKPLLEELRGCSVVTADHGNLFGERTEPIPVRGYGHPRDLFVPELIDVPWHVVENERRDTSPDPPVGIQAVDEQTTEERLSALGYV